MRTLIVATALLAAVAAHAQLVNGDFEQAVPAGKLSDVWTVQGDLLPANWTYNTQYGGPVGLVGEAHGGKYALHFAASKQSNAHVLGATFPAKPGEV